MKKNGNGNAKVAWSCYDPHTASYAYFDGSPPATVGQHIGYGMVPKGFVFYCAPVPGGFGQVPDVAIAGGVLLFIGALAVGSIALTYWVIKKAAD